MHNPLSALSNHELFQWNSSQGDFVTFAMLMARMGGPDFDDPHFIDKVDEIGEVLLKVIAVDIAPYPDFKTMHQAVPPSPNLILKMLDCMNGQMAFDDMVDSTGVELSPESQTEQLYSMAWSYEMVHRLSPYLQFKSSNENGDPFADGEGRDV